jgi:hypothetical protein
MRFPGLKPKAVIIQHTYGIPGGYLDDKDKDHLARTVLQDIVQ